MIIAHGIVHRGTVVVLQLLFPESQQLGIKNLFVVRSVFAIRTAFQYSRMQRLTRHTAAVQPAPLQLPRATDFADSSRSLRRYLFGA